MAIPQDKVESSGTADIKNTNITGTDTSETVTLSTTEAPIKKATSKILEPKYDKIQKCDYKECPIKTKEILMGMHCVFFEKKTYHAFCGTMLKLDFKVQQPALRPTEAK